MSQMWCPHVGSRLSLSTIYARYYPAIYNQERVQNVCATPPNLGKVIITSHGLNLPRNPMWDGLSVIDEGMLSSILRSKKGREGRDRSPFSSPYNGIVSSPIATRRGVVEERRRAAADFNVDDSVEEHDGEEQRDEEHYPENDRSDGADEDGHDETTPLLPIFSAEYLGMPLTFIQGIYIE